MSQRFRPTGVMLIWVVVVGAALMMMATLAVDFDRAEIAKSELRRAADGAARAGASSLGDYNAVQSAAVQFASDNTCLGDPVSLDVNNDIEFGNWDTNARTFTP